MGSSWPSSLPGRDLEQARSSPQRTLWERRRKASQLRRTRMLSEFGALASTTSRTSFPSSASASSTSSPAPPLQLLFSSSGSLLLAVSLTASSTSSSFLSPLELWPSSEGWGLTCLWVTRSSPPLCNVDLVLQDHLNLCVK